jgi:hypothetical protein
MDSSFEYTRKDGVFVQVFPLQNFNPGLLPKVLVPPKPRTPRRDAAAPENALA